jgi:PAS domain S-box-containing protein
MAALLFRDVPRLARHSAQAMPLLPGIPGMHPVVQARLLRVLAIGEQLRAGVPDAERAELTAELEACHAWLAARAADAPVNFGHVLSLMDAELAWATGDHWAAAEAFDTALRDLDGRSRPFHRALTAERAASFHLERGLERVGRGLLAEARRHYAAWGAVAKVRDLDRAYPFLRTEARGDTGGPVAGNASVGRTAGDSVGHSVVMSTESMDLLGVLRAAQALSSETNLDRLRSRVVEVLTMMTGATGVQVVLWNDESGDWYLPEATGLTSLAARGLLPISAFQYAERTLAPLCVEDATRDDRFARDPYLAGIGCCSLLVVPILSGGAPRAMLVLENRLTRGAFSADRLDAVMLIAGQLAVCLDNALAERFRSLVQRSSDLTLVCDAAGTISYASTASVELLGVEEAALAGRSVGDLVHADDRAALLAWLGDADRADVLSCRLAADIGSGAKRWVETTLTDLTADPAVGGLMLRLRDVTERRQLEDELRHAQKLESVGQLAAGIAHEINTPIQFIGDNIRFLTDAFGDIADVLQAAAPSQVATAKGGDADVDYLLEEIPQALRDTLEGATRVATIVRAMKAFGHPGGEDKAQADLNEAVRNTLVVATSEIRHVADVDLDLDPELPPVVCNLGEINQVLLNLVINAVHAMAAATADGGRGRLTVRTRRDGDAVLIQVADTGTGIPAEIADRVFDQFFTTKDVGVGTGQGLALAHTFVHEHHGGTITFESTPGAGTTFSVHLPTPP